MKKLLKWEFWPFWFFYIPVYAQWLWYSLRSRSLVFFSAANPAMNLGGFSSYSKYDILERISSEYIPKMSLLTTSDYQNAPEIIEANKFSYPLIAKPDQGERGFGVELIDSKQELIAYLKEAKGNIIIQEYINHPIELGVMYHRLPNDNHGHITSVVMKEFLTVEGDGTSTLEELLKNGERTSYHLTMLLELHQNNLNQVLPHGEKKQLQEIGNHCRGTTFLNANHLINEQLHIIFDEIAKHIDGFYFGRFDLRVSSIEDLYKGKNIGIVELNGAASEPAHIYDPSMKLIEAYKHLFQHWKHLYQVSIQNNKNGYTYTPFVTAYKQHMNYFKTR